MTNLRSRLTTFLKQDWVLSFLVLAIYLATNRYIFGWDDQHLEVPLLKHLIDPSLYQGDYYVESLSKNFTSYLYPLLARVIKVDQVPAAYLVLFLVSRYFMFYWWLKLWKLLAVRSFLGSGEDRNTKLIAFCAALYAIVLGRTEEFLYRTFSHQEFALAIVFAGIYFFYRDRYILASFLLGLAANFNALYALFPMMYVCFYLLFFHRERNWEHLIKSGLVFVISCLPFLVWTISKTLSAKSQLPPNAFDDWVSLYLLACPQNFPFAAQSFASVVSNVPVLLKELNPYLLLVSLYLYNYYANDHFRQDRRIHAISLAAMILIGTCFYFAYVMPNRFMLDLNLIRNEQFLRFFLLGWTVISATRMIQIKNLFWAFLAGLVLISAARQDFLGLVPLNICIAVMILLKTKSPHWQKTKVFMFVLSALLLILALCQWQSIIWKEILPIKWSDSFWLVLVPVVYAATVKISGQPKRGRILLVIVPILFMVAHFIQVHYRYVQISTKGEGFWQLQRNWEDMQRYVQKNTPKDAMLLIPYNMEMCGFRIQAERKILVSYRDCGIVGFDYMAAKEWQRRIADINQFKVFVDPQTIAPALVNALFKYRVDYIVFMRYYAPGDNEVVQKVYENEVFALYKVLKKT